MTGSLGRTIMSLAFIWALGLGPGPAQAGPAEAAKPADPGKGVLESPVPTSEKRLYTGQKMSIEVQNADIHRVLKMIGEVSGKNVVVSEGVSGKVTVKLLDVPWDQALDVILASRNLGVEESDNVLLIYDLPTLQRLQSGREGLARESKTPAEAGLSLE